MNIDRFDRLLNVLSGAYPWQRRIGKTFSAAALTKRVGGVLLCINRVDAKRVANEYGIHTDSIKTFEPSSTTLPIIVDQDALVFEAQELIRIMQVKEKILAVAESRLALAEAVVSASRRALDILTWDGVISDLAASVAEYDKAVKDPK